MQFLADKGARLDAKVSSEKHRSSIAAGDPNGLADDFSRPVHVSTEALLRRLMGNTTYLAPLAQRANISGLQDK